MTSPDGHDPLNSVLWTWRDRTIRGCKAGLDTTLYLPYI